MMMSDKLQQIALFPLNLFLLPGEVAQLYIFEERYKQLINDCKDGLKDFGLAFSNPANTDNYGCRVKVKEVLVTYPEGEMDIQIECTGLFKLEHFYGQSNGKLYPGGEVADILYIDNAPDEDVMNILNEFKINSQQFSSGDITVPQNSFDIAVELQMAAAEKLEFAGLQSQHEREKYLLNYIRYLKLIEEQQNSVYQNFYLN